MGFWYLLMFFVGVLLLVLGALRHDVPKSIKIVILLFSFGLIFVIGSLVLLLSGSDTILFELLE
ncbi:hypothetical protein NIE88_02970 [Sporolactobacillus shoreicorticis]|uniref:Uncharacterized protein n=1 Tax=Sporolactobacillus shoreicorticis TaxID=1923877 RepID=A0ABW5RZS4_9BACL|nr:hypothetical protein [Sporolactobacillus shoreicorticis]MCO7124737.1 hypothetical protein [Sporolactobacillus shoreicorticis]